MRYKYQRTPHLPFSPGVSSDDRVLKSLDHFQNREVVVTIKKDGENTSLYRDGFHARSLDSRHHPSRDWLAKFHAGIAHEIPEGWRICGENLYARHSIAYEGLPSYFMGFSMWDERNMALNWDDTVAYFSMLGIVPVEVLYRGIFDEKVLLGLAKQWNFEKEEGFVIRVADAFHYDDFGVSLAKWVRKNHVQTDSHWMHQAIVPNGLKVSE